MRNRFRGASARQLAAAGFCAAGLILTGSASGQDADLFIDHSEVYESPAGDSLQPGVWDIDGTLRFLQSQTIDQDVSILLGGDIHAGNPDDTTEPGYELAFGSGVELSAGERGKLYARSGIVNHGTINLHGVGHLANWSRPTLGLVEGSGGFTNAASGVIRGMGRLDGETLVNNGSIIAEGGILGLDGLNRNTGQLGIGNGGMLALGGTGYRLDHDLHVEAGQTLLLGGDWQLDADLSVRGGGLGVSDFSDTRLDQATIEDATAVILGSTSWSEVQQLDRSRWSRVTVGSRGGLGGELDLEDRVIDIDSSIFTGQTVGGRIVDGTLTASAGGKLHVGRGDTGHELRLSNVDLEAPLEVAAGQVSYFAGTISNTHLLVRDPGLGTISLGWGAILDNVSLAASIEPATFPFQYDFGLRANDVAVRNRLALDGVLGIYYDAGLVFEAGSSLDGEGQLIFDRWGPASRMDILGEQLTIGSGLTLIARNFNGVQIFGAQAELINRADWQIRRDNVQAELRRFTNHGRIQGSIDLTAGSFVNASGGSLTGASTIRVAERSFVSHGTIEPGEVADYPEEDRWQGLLVLDTDAEFTGTSTLAINLDGSTEGDERTHDRVDILGSAAIDGELVLSLLDGYVPAEGDLFTILTSDSLTGRFASVEGVEVTDDLRLAVLYQDGDVVVRPTRPGDIDLSGTVDLDDLALLGDHFGGAGSIWAEGDFTGDGLVNAEDFYLLKAQFDPTTSEALATLARFEQEVVPEPASVLLMALGLPLLARRRRDA